MFEILPVIALGRFKFIMNVGTIRCKSRGYSSVVEHSTADRKVPGSNPGVPCIFIFVI